MYKINSMDFQIFYFNDININKIKIGKKQTYNYSQSNDIPNYQTNTTMSNNSSDTFNNNMKSNVKRKKEADNQTYMMPIYYNHKNEKYKPLVIKTPRMYIPQKIKTLNQYKPSLELSFIGEREDDGIKVFKNLINEIEKRVRKILKGRRGLNLREKVFVSLLKEDYNYNTEKLYLPINLNNSTCVDINHKIIKNWEFSSPTYGYFIILVKNIWIRGDKWGVNIFTHAGMILPSQLIDPPLLHLHNIKLCFQDEIKEVRGNLNKNIQIKDVPEYAPFFKMKKFGVPINAIKKKMVVENLILKVIDYKEDIFYLNIPELQNIQFTLQDKSRQVQNDSGSEYLEIQNDVLRSQSYTSHIPIFNSNDLLNQTRVLKKINKTEGNHKRIFKSQSMYEKNDPRIPSVYQINNALNGLRRTQTVNK
jgi:hypothetical protein